ncbi:hypothetical protein JZO78_11420 [Enterococcus ureilyticus]|uniref:hypothetical protein n=1 Tax=Enterococcus ureilyticus TaxID=1131292 RepID=UPI001A90DCA1|nr:hypothetical protein [Enterococcus ureilyticus]MBO0446955.1 hypothetical protein [Enterococcus ureilyticus]
MKTKDQQSNKRIIKNKGSAPLGNQNAKETAKHRRHHVVTIRKFENLFGDYLDNNEKDLL